MDVNVTVGVSCAEIAARTEAASSTTTAVLVVDSGPDSDAWFPLALPVVAVSGADRTTSVRKYRARTSYSVSVVGVRFTLHYFYYT